MKSRSRSRIMLSATAATIALSLVGCASSSSSTTASVPSDSPAASSEPSAPASAEPSAPTSSTAAPGPVSTSGPKFAVSDCAKQEPPAGGETISGGVTINGVTVSGGAGEAPKVAIELGTPSVTELITKDLIVGTGAEVPPDGSVTVQYCGVGLASRTLFDSSWTRPGSPAKFPLNGVIFGWGQGIPGMKAGGRRLLIIPGDLAYGPNPPSGSGIAPNESLVFVVELISTP